MIENINSGQDCLALVISKDFGSYGSHFATSLENPLQVGVIERGAGDVISAHRHMPIQMNHSGIRQEFLHVMTGKVRVTFFDAEGQEVTERTLGQGDSLLQISGGHGFHFEEPTRLMEVKLGPYSTQGNDKQKYE
ncbi:MAG: hypothetical protein HN472_03835 [Nitrospina sp.]|jgi:hypothetical protein|nr:hypothetical protein [Nitrospina sp.]MBT3508659.1 hypothetical protein [Nitrospina sp.]MBT3875683.1 hypothetical protein [Nitrospina sp.]MBT4048480.1 hypothetical protein [Nitrospina sp.]MBT4558890.1 hypothetical protein [Nitrospina sp.]